MKKIILTGLLLVASGCNQTAATPPPSAATAYHYDKQLQIGGQTLNVEIADTPAAQRQGLSGRASMDEDQGMLFVFSSPTAVSFWMKDMNFNLDFIWIEGDRVIGITPDVFAPPTATPDSELVVYAPPSPADSVVEVNAGWAKKNSIAVGDDVVLK